jgi:excisionase family DNA binding protein
MKTHPTQFDVRENTASLRQHDLRLARDVRSRLIHTDEQDLNTRISVPANDCSTTDSDSALNAASQRVATAGRDASRLLTVGEVAEMLHVPVSWVYGRMRKRSRERLPGYRLGKYWRFRVEEVLQWVQDHHEGFDGA